MGSQRIRHDRGTNTFTFDSECGPGSAPASPEICCKLKLGSLAHPKSQPCALTGSLSDPHTHSSVDSNSFSNYRFILSCTRSTASAGGCGLVRPRAWVLSALLGSLAFVLRFVSWLQEGGSASDHKPWNHVQEQEGRLLLTHPFHQRGNPPPIPRGPSPFPSGTRIASHGFT